MSWITAPFAWLLKALYELTGSYGWAVILFGVVVNLILLPFMAKSKKSMMRTSRLQPRIAELQRRHEGNQQKLNEEMAKLYREEKINPMSGCLWSLIPFPILIALYSVIRQPLTKMMSLSADAVTQLTDWVTTNAGYVAQTKSAYQEIQIADLIHQNWDAVTGALGDFSGKLLDIDYSFIGLNMGQQPSFKIWTFDWSNKAVWLPALGLFLIPIVSAVLSWLSMKISTSMTPQPAANQQQAATTNKTMMIMMPLVSLWICYTMPAALGIYWIVNSILGILRDVSLTKVFNKQLDKLDAERIAREKERDAELERKRLETERLKAAGETVVNPNTSKKKIQVKIPAGIDDDQNIALRGQGDAGSNGGPAGDVIVHVTVKADPMFERDGYDVTIHVPITFSQAVLGDDVEVPTVDGRIVQHIPEGTQSGTKFRLRGQGIQYLNGRGRGDQYVIVDVEIPKKVTRAQREALKAFEDSMKEDNYEKRKGFFKNLRDRFS